MISFSNLTSELSLRICTMSRKKRSSWGSTALTRRRVNKSLARPIDLKSSPLHICRVRIPCRLIQKPLMKFNQLVVVVELSPKPPMIQQFQRMSRKDKKRTFSMSSTRWARHRHWLPSNSNSYSGNKNQFLTVAICQNHHISTKISLSSMRVRKKN